MAPKIYARDNTLYNLARDVGWGFCTTNAYGSAGKSHLLEMRSGQRGGPWVKNVGYSHPEVIKSGLRASYSDKLAFYYCITFKGFVHLLETFPDTTIFNGLKADIFKRAFSGESKDKDFVDFRI